MGSVVVEEFVKRQKSDLEEMARLKELDPERARRESQERLRRAGILDDHGELTPFYRN